MKKINTAKYKAELNRIKGIDEFCPTSGSRESALRRLVLELISQLEAIES